MIGITLDALLPKCSDNYCWDKSLIRDVYLLRYICYFFYNIINYGNLFKIILYLKIV